MPDIKSLRSGTVLLRYEKAVLPINIIAYPIVTMFWAVTLLSTAFKMTHSAYSGIEDLIHEIITYKKGARFAYSYFRIPSWP